jgi:mannan endo-1,4-beta-mannosidase
MLSARILFSIASMSLAATPPASNSFVTAVNDQLTLNGSLFRFGGANCYVLMFSPHSTVDQLLGTAASNHFNVVRMWSFDDIDVPSSNNSFYLQYWNGSAPAYNDSATTGLANVDYAIYRAGQLGIKLIIPFVNNWPDYGGMDQYVNWLGEKYHDEFYTDPTIRQWYKNWISHVLNHVNALNGLAYKDDPTIMIWELANEPRCQGEGLPTSGTCTTSTIQSWIQDVAAYIKSVDSNHLVSVGDEGFFCIPTAPPSDFLENCSSGVDTLAFAQTANIDIFGFHLYPESVGQTVAWADTFLDEHFADSMKPVNKPAYMGEFGLMAGNSRNAVYKDWTDRVFNDGGSGALFWDLLPGTSISTSESPDGFDLEAASPILETMGNFEQEMAANSMLPFAPVAGDQWATAASNVAVTLSPLANDIAYDGATIAPSSINLKTSGTVYGGTFTVMGQSVQFTPSLDFNGNTQVSYTVEDSNHKLSNAAYLFVSVSPSPTGPWTLESFEFGTDGWGPVSPAAGTVSQTSAFHTDGNSGLQVNVTTGGWFGVLFPSALDLSARAALAIDIQTPAAAGTSAIAFQSGSSYVWCQNANFEPLPSNEPSTITVALDPTQLTCFNGTPDFTNVKSAMVYLGGAGTYYLDNLRALPVANANSPTVTGALNGAGFVVGAPLPEGGIASLFGSNLATTITYASEIPLPNSLDNVSVTVNGIPAPLFFVSPLQINVQIPWNALSTPTGTGNIVVTTGTGVSQAFSAPLAATAPALLTTNSGIGQAIAINSDGSLADATHPAKPGDILVLLANGLGPVTSAITDGTAPGAATRNTVTTPTVLIGGVSANVQFSGLSPQFVGLNQINVQVPTGVSPSDTVPIQLKIGSTTTSSKVTIAISHP